MDLMKICSSVPGDRSVKIKIITKSPVRIRFYDKNELSSVFSRLTSELSTVIFNVSNFYVSNCSCALSNSELCKYLESTDEETITCEVYFGLDLKTNDHTPTIETSRNICRLEKHDIRIEVFVIACLQKNGLNLYELLRCTLNEYLSFYKGALLQTWDSTKKVPKTMYPHHFVVLSKQLTILYPDKINEDLEYSWRESIHGYLKIPSDSPVFRRGQAMHSVPKLSKWLGPNNDLLVCPHEAVKIPVGQSVYIIKGRYTYKHYLQDATDDKNWGCAYRSLQTLISWLMWQGEIEPKKLPSITDIQASLVRVGDKPKTFVGSRQWIGSLEVSFCLQEMYSIQCRLLPVPKGSQMSQIAAPILAQHFASGGGPVMIGGGQLAHTIIGIQLPEVDSFTDNAPSPKYLILDPHYTGPPGCLKTVIGKGWCGWKVHNFWKPDVHYNLCFVPPIQPGRV